MSASLETSHTDQPMTLEERHQACERLQLVLDKLSAKLEARKGFARLDGALQSSSGHSSSTRPAGTSLQSLTMNVVVILLLLWRSSPFFDF